MKISPLIKTAIIFLASALFVSGCDNVLEKFKINDSQATNTANTQAVQKNNFNLDVPALAVIQNTVASMVPTFERDTDHSTIKEICGLAEGKFTQKQVNDWMKSKSIDGTKVPATGSSLSLLINGQKEQQNVACAAYVSSSALSLIEFSDFTVNVPTQQNTDENKDPEKTKESDKPVSTTQSQLKIDDSKLKQYLATKLAVAKTNTEFYILIASQLQKTPNLTLKNYQNKVRKIFSILAPFYLQRVNSLYQDTNIYYNVITLNQNILDFISSDGYHFTRNMDGMTLKYNDIPWYGAGHLMGKYYTLPTNYYNPEIIYALNKLDKKKIEVFHPPQN